jgi:hypothetical protein
MSEYALDYERLRRMRRQRITAEMNDADADELARSDKEIQDLSETQAERIQEAMRFADKRSDPQKEG